MEKIKVLLVDDELLIREGLRIMLGTFSGIEIVGTAENGEKAVEFCKKNQVDVVLMDIRMPICDGVLGTRLIKEQFKDIKVLILTTFKDSEYIKEAFKFGAYGYLLKDSTPEVIYEAIKSAYNGNIVINHEMAEKIIQKEDVKNINIDDYNLSKKEINIIDGIARGLTNKEISGELFLSEGTIKNNITNILSKLELRDRTQIAIFAFKNRIVT
ncbi:MAG: response regulator transcription factor [Sarcina sp.]